MKWCNENTNNKCIDCKNESKLIPIVKAPLLSLKILVIRSFRQSVLRNAYNLYYKSNKFIN